MQTLAIALLVVGALVSIFGITRFLASRRQVLAPGEVGINVGQAVATMAAGDGLLVIGVLLLVL